MANQFNGTVPNGTWNLFVADDVSSGTASGIQGGWSLDITTSDSILPTRTVLISSANPGQTTESVTLTASVTKVSDTSHVTAGTVTFINGTTVLAGPGPIAEDGTVRPGSLDHDRTHATRHFDLHELRILEASQDRVPVGHNHLVVGAVTLGRGPDVAASASRVPA